MNKEEASMLNHSDSCDLTLSRSISLFLAALVIVGSVTVLSPSEGGVVEAPLAAGTLNVTWENLAPETNTYQGDANLTMLWLALKAEGANITLESIKINLWGLPSQGVDRAFAWDDWNGDKDMSNNECIIAIDASSPYILPPSGQMVECTGPNIGQPVVIRENTTKYFMIYLDLYFDPTEKFTDRDLWVCIKPADITSSALDLVGITTKACSRTINVNKRLFYDDMEQGQGDWVFGGGDGGGMHPNGLWHLSQDEEDCNLGGRPFYHSANTSWWYGHRYNVSGMWICDYYTHEPGNPIAGTRNWGKLRSPWIDVRRGSNLAVNVWHFLVREQWSTVDLAHVYLNDGSGWHFVSSEEGTSSFWKKLIYNLSAYAGKQLQLEFRFDTVDETNNRLLGWFIDDFVMYGELLDHDISVTDLSLGDYVTLDPQTVTARVSNVGLLGENNVGINLTQDGTPVDSRIISSLPSGSNTTVNFSWTPPGNGTYEMCVQTSPVVGETILWNNNQCKLVNATSQTFTKVAVLRSYGTQIQSPKETWDYLNANWGNYGQDPIAIDYASLDINPITYQAINDTQADVLVLSGSGYYFGLPVGTELADSETWAIEKWVREGHGFVSIGTAFHELVPNNNDLVDLVGIVDQPYARDDVTDIEVLSGCVGHPIFNNVPDLFQTGFNRTTTPNNDHSWDASDIDGGQMCARSPGRSTAAIIVFKGSVMISFAADNTPSEEERQLLYNAFVWSRFQAYGYDVKVSNLLAPRFVRPFYNANISSIVSNIGVQDLPTVQVTFEIDGAPIDTFTLSNFAHGNQTYANFSWNPSLVGTYQICVLADVVGNTDEDPSNNEVCTSVNITNNPPVQVFVLDSWGTDFAQQAPWDYLNANWASHGSVPVLIDYTRFNKENIRYQEFVDSFADVLLISSSRSGNMNDPVSVGYLFTDEEMDAIVRYVQEGHGLIATGLTFDGDKLPRHSAFLGQLFGLDPGNQYTYTTGINNFSVINPSENHPLFHNISENYNTADGTTLTPGFYVTGPENWTSAHLAGGRYKALSSPAEYAAVITNESGDYNAVYVTNFVEANSNANDKQLLYNAMVWGRANLASPTNLWIYKSGDTLRLEWVNSFSSNVQGYRIYRARSVNSFDFNDIYDVVPSGTSQWADPQSDAGIDPKNYFYLVRAFDDRGNEEQNLNKVGKFVNQLYKGTNEISIGFELKDSNTSVAFESVDGLYKYVEAFDPYTCTWKAWSSTGGGALVEINRSMGLRVRMKSAGLLINVGRVTFTSVVIPEAGACGNWNFVGYPSFETKSLPGILDNGGMAGKYDLVLYYDPADRKAKWKFFDPDDPGGSTLKALSPGMGIWLHVTQAGIWRIEGD